LFAIHYNSTNYPALRLILIIKQNAEKYPTELSVLDLEWFCRLPTSHDSLNSTCFLGNIVFHRHRMDCVIRWNSRSKVCLSGVIRCAGQARNSRDFTWIRWSNSLYRLNEPKSCWGTWVRFALNAKKQLTRPGLRHGMRWYFSPVCCVCARRQKNHCWKSKFSDERWPTWIMEITVNINCQASGFSVMKMDGNNVPKIDSGL
jgi:hypothetical protein